MKTKLLTTLAVGISILSIANIANAISWSNQTASTVTVTDIGNLGGNYSIGTGINNVGQVTGYSPSIAGGYHDHAFVWTPGYTMTDLGTLGGNNSYGSGINDAGWVTGNSFKSDNSIQHAFLWTPGYTMNELGTLGGGIYSDGYGINNAGQVSGTSNNGIDFRAVVWNPDGTMTDLVTPAYSG